MSSATRGKSKTVADTQWYNGSGGLAMNYERHNKHHAALVRVIDVTEGRFLTTVQATGEWVLEINHDRSRRRNC